MELILTGAKISLFQPKNLTRNCSVKLFTGRTGGLKSELLTFGVDVPTEKEEKSGWLMVDINRNTAKYLINFLSAYINEDEIDIDAED